MSWDHPFVLGIVPLAIAVVWWTFRRSSGVARAAFSRIRRLWADETGLHDSPAAQRRRGRGLLLALGTVLAVVALARPQWGKIEETTYDQSREVLLALDLSRSMLADDVAPTRLDRAKLLVDSLLDQLRGERVGLVVFAGTSFLQSPMSADYEVLRDFLRDLDPSYLPQGGTNYGAMLQTAVKAFGQQGDGDRFLVVLSDGEALDEDWKALLPTLQQKGIHVLGLGVGTAAGALVPDGQGGVEKDEQGAAVLSRLEPATLQELATQTGGTYRDAATWVDIAELVNASVEQGRAGRYVEQKEVRLRDQYQWFLAPAVLFLLFSFWLDFPVLPVPRSLKKTQRAMAPVRAASAAAALLTLVAASTQSNAAVTEPAPAAPSALEQTVAALADKPSLVAPDYAELANKTIEYASQPNAPQSESRIPVIDDALRGVDAGEQLDAKAADWPQLRQQLEQLKKQEEQKQQEQQQEQQQQEQSQKQDEQQDKKDQQQQAGGGQQNDEQKQDQQQAGGAGQQDDQQKDEQQQQQQAGGESQPNASDSEPEQGNAENQQPQSADTANEQKRDQQDANGEEPRDEQENLANGSAEPKNDKPGEPKPLDDADAKIGTLDDSKPEEKPEQPAEQPKPPTRLVGGGQPQKQPADSKDLALVEALDRMQRIQDGDSPSTLFDRMNRAEGAPPPAKTGKNW